MTEDFPLTALALVVALLLYFALSLNVGMARSKYNCPAPASSGHPEFDKRYRVQMNTLEQLALFLPAVLMAAPVLGDLTTAVLALIWSLGRIVYARTYYADPTKRGPGFGLTMLPTTILLSATIWGAIGRLAG